MTSLLLESAYFPAQFLNLEALGFKTLDPQTGGRAGKNGLNLVVLQLSAAHFFHEGFGFIPILFHMIRTAIANQQFEQGCGLWFFSRICGSLPYNFTGDPL
jgi:hypothetical protein